MTEQSRYDTRLDRFVDHYDERTHSLKVSAIRALFAVANRPEIVSLAGGMPNISDLPLNDISQNVSELIRKHGPTVMQYGSGQGEPGLREHTCMIMQLEGISAHPDDVVITAGSQQGLDLVTRVFCDPHDVILVESPSYVGALGTFISYQCDVVHVDCDDDGLNPTALQDTIDRLVADGRRIKLLYTIPNFSNPAGITQPVERRREILDVCRRNNVLVVEDNPYGLLCLDSTPQPALRSMDEDVIYLSSFSKTFAPGFRIGWVLAPHAVREKLVLVQESATLCPPVFSQFTIENYLDSEDWQQQIVSFRDMYRHRRDTMLRSLTEHMPDGCSWTEPGGGFFVWVTMPEGLNAESMLPRGVNARVAFVPGNAFYADGQGSNNVRLSYCFPPSERIAVGVQRFADVVRHELDMMQTFGVHHMHRFAHPPEGPAPDTA